MGLINSFISPLFAGPHSAWNFNAIFYSMVQVYKGIPLYINGFTNIYGMYPIFFESNF